MPEEQAIQESITLSTEERAVLKTLLYFDIFNYPLKPSEIHQFAPIKMSPINVVPCLNFMSNCGLIQQLGSYYSVKNDQELVTRRELGNKSAKGLMNRARRMSKFISRFPFVRGVYISGSLSKGFIDEEGDIDFFIITKPGRLWIARSLLIAFKKVFLLNSKKYFCVNYFIDTDHLEIPDKNIFTATEVRTLLPMYNLKLYEDFVAANGWAEAYLPNYKPQDTDSVIRQQSYLIKGVVETILRWGIGNWFDERLMKATMRRWKAKFSHFTDEYFEHALRSRKYVSKHNPQNFQKKVLDALEEKEVAYKKDHSIQFE
ncbi:MAG TPA: nucleotidyltransferase [Flavobacteriales bacterium]|nr:nucleotidyltransferase [Flavobacteriales bacterium]